ncbi:MAG: hypothetical protein ACOYNL_09860 [Rickettsiales bacterium]
MSDEAKEKRIVIDLDGCMTIFRDTVEGRPSEFRLKIEDETLVWDSEIPITANSGTSEHLIPQLLRSDFPLTKTFRNWIADLLDPNADTNFCYKDFSRRHSGRRPKWDLWEVEAGLYVEERVKNDGYESAILAAMEEFGLKRTVVKNAYAKVKKARAEA